ncbi:hypothetical protein PMIN01_10181 [Paraphaeosphaeria minitans]|uniref:Uncharacterized protein n=1 Tax=Paraphaeosphaeria minitans TaxID=565426 RepID=A0A9P6GB37_9PLEO|nr:hypothetical protein PMIN01_10181 [Paraphaeosphaeria minitans]
MHHSRELTVPGNSIQQLALYTDASFEYAVDSIHYFGGDYLLDPRRTAASVLQSQHGEVDDNVPSYNSRFLCQQLFLSDTSYNEIPGQDHWWDTLMTTPELVDFYYWHTNGDGTLPRKLDELRSLSGIPEIWVRKVESVCFISSSTYPGTITTTRFALRVSLRLHQYFQAAANIVSSTSWDGTTNGTGNVVTLALGDTTPSSIPNFPIQPSDSRISVRDSKGVDSYGRTDESVWCRISEAVAGRAAGTCAPGK